MRIGSVILACIASFLLGITVASKTEKPYSYYQWGERACEVNGGVKSFDHYRVTCANGAVFDSKRGS